MNPAKHASITLFLVFIFMDMPLAIPQSCSPDDTSNCNAQEEIICKEQFSSLSCQIEFAHSKKCVVRVCANSKPKHFETSPVNLNDQNLTEYVTFSVISDNLNKKHCYVTCCLKENTTMENLCFDNKCQFKKIFILNRKSFTLYSNTQNICLSGNYAAIKKAFSKEQIDKKLMTVGLQDKVYYDKVMSIEENGVGCQEDWQIIDSNRENWESVFHKNITNCLLKSKLPNQVINESYTLVLKGKNGPTEIWHFLVVKSGSPVTDKTTTVYYKTTMIEKKIVDSLQNGTSNLKEHILEKLIDSVKNLTGVVMENKDKMKIFVEVLNNITKKNCWTNLKNAGKVSPTKVMKVVDEFLEDIIHATNSSEKVNIERENIAFQFDELKNNTISVNLDSDESLKVHIDESVIKNISSDDHVFYSVVFYKSLTYIIQMTEANWTNESTNHKDLLSDILGFTIHKVNLKSPIKNITFRLSHKKLTSKTKCAYWSSSSTNLIGEWKTDGCFRTSGNESYTECVCNHLTNFAILMSHHQVENTVTINIMSMIGGVVSILAVFLTFVCYMILWRYVTTTTLNKSRAIILMNLCVSMFIANLLFLLSNYLKSYKLTCTVTSILLHFFYLAVFFTMFVEGIDIFVTIVFVFSKIDVKKLILVAWGFPAIIVAISAGVTRLQGYGEEDHCWLSNESGLKWAFVGPAFFIIFTNLVITLVVLKNMLRNSEMIQKPIMERARAGMWGLVLFSPILGFTWCFGIFLFHKSIIVQYVFVACHSLQGLLIFLLHCLFSKQIKDGFKQYMKKIKNKSQSKSNITNSVCKSVALDKTQTPTLTINRSVDNLTLPYPQTLGIFQSRKSQDLLVPPKKGIW